jgi:hypothetical protein
MHDGYTFMELVPVPFSAGDDHILKVEIYLKGDEMVTKLLETGKLFANMGRWHSRQAGVWTTAW